VRHAHTRRSKLYYVRDKAVRDVRRRLKADNFVGAENTEATKEEAAN
jgi:hypothetical protein